MLLDQEDILEKRDIEEQIVELFEQQMVATNSLKGRATSPEGKRS